jgi:hypothetical protein
LLRGFVEAALEFSRQIWGENNGSGPPKKVFSVYQSLRTSEPKINGRIVLHDQGCPIVKSDSIMVTGGYRQHREQPWPIFWSEHRQTNLVTESLALLSNDKSLCLESVYGWRRLRDDPASRFFRLPPVTSLAGNWTSIVSRWVPTEGKRLGISMPNYTHWMLDALPRLALMPEFPADTKILVPADLHRNQKESLALLGLWERCRPTTEQHLKIERYFFSSPTTMLQCYNPYAIQFLRERFLLKRDRTFSSPKRVFVKRVGLSREPLNAGEIEQFFEKRGWTPIDVVKLTFAQQVQLFHEAESIAGMFGSAFTNCVFCKPGCEVIPIMPVEFGMDGFLEWIGQVVGYDLHPFVLANDYTYRFSVDLDALGKWLESESLIAGNVLQPSTSRRI